MADIIITNNNKTFTFKKFNYQEMKEIKETYPNLTSVTFEDCLISDFSLLELFKDCNLYFKNCVIASQTIPLTLNSRSIGFEETVVDFRNMFFKTDMPNLSSISFNYDSLEGIKQYARHFSLLAFYPTLESIKILHLTKDGKTYLDMDHKKEFKSDILGSNLPVLQKSDLSNNLSFLVLMPKYGFKTNDGIVNLMKDDELWKMNLFFRKFWINPRLMGYYESYKYHDLKKIKEVLRQAKIISYEYKKRFGVSIKDIECKDPISTWPDLSKVLTERYRTSRLGVKTEFENEEPSESQIYGLHGKKLYDTKGHNIIVNSRGSIISDKAVDKRTGKVKNYLLPF